VTGLIARKTAYR